jgi:hypothetical protein
MEQLILNIFILILWIVYSSLFGICDAYYWYSANVGKYCAKDFKFKDLHPHYFWMRSIVGSVFAVIMSGGFYFKWFPITICIGMIFPFFHNGFYYKTRNEIDPTKYELGFRDMSTTSIAKVNFTFGLRTILMIGGIIGLALLYTLKF